MRLFSWVVVSRTSICRECVLRKGRKMENIINGSNGNIITENTTLGELIKLLGPVSRADKTPTSKALRETAGEPIAESNSILIYANGYAVYDGDSGRTVVWIPSCVAFTYHFDPMKESEKGGEIRESVDLPAGLLESQPWPIAITLIGDHQAERRSMHRKGDRKETKSLIRGDNEEGDAMEGNDEHEHSLAKEYSWRDEQIGEDPESIYIRMESRQEALANMTNKQRQAFLLYFKYGYNQREIADMLGVAQRAVAYRIEGALGHMKKIF